ncbi:acyl-CoA/acyl-ACP dehydrogenase [Streptomyces sp. A7024]|uniref:Acyl-CoA/acyl-ACP dehydrogenase n=1 Tax=Streptomyces coryli TaxID=1128680 RepID=A0A6G4U4Q2_9ACTN|nr:acyl-CoA/acyl-ACP dehydrogenase [Streptomyces coryli]
MDFRLTDDQRALRQGMRELLDGRFGREALRAAADADGLDRELWRELGEAGLFTLRVPEADGGVGLGLPEAVLVFEEAGRALVPGPLVATHLAGARAEPGSVVTAVWEEGGLVDHLADADYVLAGDGLLPAEPVRAAAEPVRSVDPLTPLHRSAGTAGPRAVHEAALLTAALQLGTAGWAMDAAVAYAKEREQFGRPIGSFQAVQHLCARLLVRAEPARAAVYAAAVTGDPGEIAAAKLLADEAAVAGMRDCLQVHGGMGFTWEADVHLHLKRAWLRAEQWQRAGVAEEELAAAL